VTNYLESATMKYPFPKNTLYVPLLLMAAIWGTFLLQLMGVGQYNCYGVVPRESLGLRGILFAPLFHSGWKHIISNSFPLIVLSFFAVMFYKRMAYYVIIFGWLGSGLLVWLFGNLLPGDTVGCHIGASGVVYVLATYVFFSGVLRKSRNLIAISLIIVFLYGSMIWGVFPEEFLPKFYTEESNPISWESHLAGAIMGIIFAFITRNYGEQGRKYSWEDNPEPDDREKWLWEQYKEGLSEEERILLEKKYGENSTAKESEDPDYWYYNDSR
jgi:membrane associated rhomboid family serine protease